MSGPGPASTPQPPSSSATASPATPASSSSYLPVLIFGCAILVLSNGARSSFGLFMPEMAAARGWTRETFSLAIAWQSLLWGLGGSFLGAMADRYGSTRVLIGGAILYALGFLGMAWARTGLELSLTAGVMLGVAIGGTSFGIVLATLGKIVPPDKRSAAFGIGVAAGSFGQFLFVPVTQQLIARFGWQPALWAHAAVVALMILLALGVRGPGTGAAAPGELKLGQSLREALRDRSFHLLFWGYFVCGLQVVFIALHLPAYLIDRGLSANVGATSIAIVGLFNIIGSLGAGWLGSRWSKKWLLASIYVARSIVIIVFLMVPLSAVSAYVFSAAMGVLWLSTVPPTNALVGQIYGTRALGMLGGVVFFGHQIGSFLGAWLGGRIFDATGSYDWAWFMVIAFGAFAAVMHAPIDQRPLGERRRAGTVPVAAGGPAG